MITSPTVAIHNVVGITQSVDVYHGDAGYDGRSYAFTTLKFKCRNPITGETENVEFSYFHDEADLQIEEADRTNHYPKE